MTGPSESFHTAFTIAIDAARVADDSWLGVGNVRGVIPLAGSDEVEQVSMFVREMALATGSSSAE